MRKRGIEMKKNAYILSYGDLFKGLIVGLILGALITYLLMSGVLPFGGS